MDVLRRQISYKIETQEGFSYFLDIDIVLVLVVHRIYRATADEPNNSFTHRSLVK